MKKLLAFLMIFLLLYSAASAEALPVEENLPLEELHAEMTFADVMDQEVLVAGPLASREYIENYISDHPQIVWEIDDYLYMYDVVKNFREKYPHAENYNTYIVYEDHYEPVKMDAGYYVTFHQNLAADDPFGGYSEESYAAMIAIAIHELDAEYVYVGYFGNPEISFLCMDKEKALRFAVQHNQNSIYCVATDDTLVNPMWDGNLNPIEGVE